MGLGKGYVRVGRESTVEELVAGRSRNRGSMLGAAAMSAYGAQTQQQGNTTWTCSWRIRPGPTNQRRQAPLESFAPGLSGEPGSSYLLFSGARKELVECLRQS